MNKIFIPNRFESVLEDSRFEYSALLMNVQSDLKKFESLANLIRVQNGGILAFLIGASGVGKTSSVYSASVFLKDQFDGVVSVPPEMALRDVMKWLQVSISIKKEKITLVLFDGREVTDDHIGLKELISSLNQLLRRRNDLLFVWPTTDSDWHSELRDIVEKVGGSNLSPEEADVYIEGPQKNDWSRIFERLLIQLDLTLQDAGLDNKIVLNKVEQSNSIGNFLNVLSREFAQRITIKQNNLGLPEILFVISSGEEVTSEANRLRRAGTYILKAEELVSYSPQSSSGKWWQARQSNSKHHLAYIISLFNVRLLTLSQSSVAHSCLHEGDNSLKLAAGSGGLNKHNTNLQTTFNATDFAKFFQGKLSAELTSSRKGKNSNPTREGFDAVQKLSAKNHKSINQAICNVLENLNSDVHDFSFEVDAGDQNLYTDVILHWQNRKYYLEFHHLSREHCNAAKMASYMMEKLKGYAIHYNIIPR